MRKNNFDAVQFMRDVRDRMSAEMQGMSFEEQKVYIEQRASKVRAELGGDANRVKPAKSIKVTEASENGRRSS